MEEGAGGLGSAGGAAIGGDGNGGEGGQMPCLGAEVQVCGTDVGECETGTKVCQDDVFLPCEGHIPPAFEACNGLDDDCDGTVDNGFGVGEACDGDDTDACLDDVLTCQGCTSGPSVIEICNGVDDNCNGTIDADCEVGDCQPNLLVVGSTPSSPSCIDFPVEAGTTGGIQYPCEGGPVSAVLGSISFSGFVSDGLVSLSGTAQLIGPDGCLWQTDHFIDGKLASGTLTYSYQEILLTPPPIDCWSPCTETGTVEVDWRAGG